MVYGLSLSHISYRTLKLKARDYPHPTIRTHGPRTISHRHLHQSICCNER